MNLPENREIEVVCCPLCRHTFTPPAVPRIIQAPLPVPTERIPPTWKAIDEGDSAPSRPLVPINDEDHPPPRSREEERRAMESAGGWMRIMAWIGLAGTLPCCGTAGVINQDGSSILLCVLVASFAGIMAGARAFQNQRGYRWAVTGVVATLLTTSGLTLVFLPLLLLETNFWPLSARKSEGSCCGFLLIFPVAVVILCGLVGGIKGLVILLRPGARALFETRDD